MIPQNWWMSWASSCHYMSLLWTEAKPKDTHLHTCMAGIDTHVNTHVPVQTLRFWFTIFSQSLRNNATERLSHIYQLPLLAVCAETFLWPDFSDVDTNLISIPKACLKPFVCSSLTFIRPCLCCIEVYTFRKGVVLHKHHEMQHCDYEKCWLALLLWRNFLMQTLSHMKTSDAAQFYPFLFVQEIR